MREVVLALVLVTAALTGCIGADDASTPSNATDGEATAPLAPSPATAAWNASSCTGVSAVWTPPIDALDDVVGPWTPAEGPVPDHGVFVLFAFECPESTIDGAPTGEVTGGAAIVPIQTPEDTHGVEADGWLAVPQALGDVPVTDLFAGHGFATVYGNASIATEPTPGGTRAEMTYATANGTITATGTVEPQTEAREPTTAIVADHAQPFSLVHGPETMQRSTGQAVVEASGDTWVSRLGLEPTPLQLSLDTEFGWNFTFERDAS